MKPQCSSGERESGTDKRRYKGQPRNKLLPSVRRLSRRKKWVEKRRHRKAEGMDGSGNQNTPLSEEFEHQSTIGMVTPDGAEKLTSEVPVKLCSVDCVHQNTDAMDFECSREESDLVLEEATEEDIVAMENIEDNCAEDVVPEEPVVEGDRIVDLMHFFGEIQKLARHSDRFACGIAHLKILSEKRDGLRTTLRVQCAMCMYEGAISSHPEEQSVLDVNHGAVAGTMATGGGYAQLEEFLGSMNVPCMSRRKYDDCHEDLVHGFKKAAATEMDAAEERRLAVARGDIVPGTNLPHIPVITDGAWMKRSYRTGKYNSLSGVGAIVGFHTQKVLFFSVRNKFCAICLTAAKRSEEPRKHTCYKNWGRNQTSTAMESDIIVEGFKASVQMHGLIYSTLIGDGDSSVYKKIRDNDPYKNVLRVKKVECTNHLLRNMMQKIHEILPKIPKGPCRLIVEKSAMRIRTGVLRAAMRRMSEENVPHAMKIANLKKDIDNVASHVFGEHKRCRELSYFCPGTQKESEENMVPQLIQVGAYQKIQEILQRPRLLAESLLHRMNSNAVESFNAIIAKFVGGKRINYGRKGSYEGRCAAAVVQYNTGSAISNLSKAMGKKPSTIQERFERRRKMQVARTKKAKIADKERRGYVKGMVATRDKDYGDRVEKPDMEKEEYESEVQRHYTTLIEWQNNRSRIEAETRDQGDSQEWSYYRRHMLTASNFGPVCTRLPTTKCAKLVQQLIYPQCVNVKSLAYGKKHEAAARQAMEKQLGLKIHPCGLFIDSKIAFLGASPDGLIDEDGIVEIKCPKSAEDYTPEEAYLAKCKAVVEIYKDGSLNELKTRHRYHWQVQGQLHVTGRRYCIFGLWTPKGLKCTTVYRDDQFWVKEMEPKLIRFYQNCMLRELVDSRYNRGMPIREPQYILDAISEKKSKK